MKDDWGGNHKDNPDARMHRPRKGRGRKDRKRWCRGKVGVEHEYEVVIPKNLAGWRRGGCFESFIHSWWGEPMRERHSYWVCHHSLVCANCGRIAFEKPECPDMPSGALSYREARDRAVAEAKENKQGDGE